MSERPEQRKDPVDVIIDQWATVRPDLDTRAMEVFGRVNRLSHAIGERVGQAYAKFGISRGSSTSWRPCAAPASPTPSRPGSSRRR